MKGSYLVFGAKGEYEHLFGGAHSTEGAWCPNCSKPLMLHLSFDLRDPLLAFYNKRPDITQLRLFYCMRCALSYRVFSYRLVTQNVVEIVNANRGPTALDDWNEMLGVDAFPVRPITLSPIPGRLQVLWDRLNSLENGDELSSAETADVVSLTRGYAFPDIPDDPSDYYVNQVGGRALLQQAIHDPACPHCRAQGNDGQLMYFLACLYNDSKNRLHVAFECVQIVWFLCPNCFTVSVVHTCD
jgi:hypothetical protein